MIASYLDRFMEHGEISQMAGKLQQDPGKGPKNFKAS